MDQSPAGPTRTLLGQTGPPQDESGHRDASGPEGRARAPQKKINELGQIRALRDEPEHH